MALRGDIRVVWCVLVTTFAMRPITRCRQDRFAYRLCSRHVSAVPVRFDLSSMLRVVSISTGSTTTASATGKPNGVRLVVGVSLRTLGLASMDSESTVAAKNVFNCRHGFEMFRVHTLACTAQMVDHEFVWDRSDKPLVHKTVDRLVFPTHLDLAVPISIERTVPGPAVRPDIAHNELPEAVPEHPVVKRLRKASAQHGTQSRDVSGDVRGHVHRFSHEGRCMSTTYGNQLRTRMREDPKPPQPPDPEPGPEPEPEPEPAPPTPA